VHDTFAGAGVTTGETRIDGGQPHRSPSTPP
jgi:hypothetical protein